MVRRGSMVAVLMVVTAGTPFAGQASTGATKAPAQKPVQADSKDSEGETKVQLKSLPPAVRATVETETKSATLKGISKEKEKGQTVYELETVVDGRTRDLMIDASGKVYEVEEQIDPTKAPDAVRSALEAKGSIVKLESVLGNGRTTYEGQVTTKAGKTITMEIDADGKPLKK